MGNDTSVVIAQNAAAAALWWVNNPRLPRPPNPFALREDQLMPLSTLQKAHFDRWNASFERYLGYYSAPAMTEGGA